MKNKTFLFMGILILVSFLVGCEQQEPQSETKSVDKITIVTTLYPLYEFVNAVGADNVDVTLIIPPGAEPHTFEPKPSDIIKIKKADLFLYIGADMEPWAHDIIEGVDNPELTLLDASSKVNLLKSDEHEDEHGDEDHEEECSEHSGTWIEDHEECEGISKEDCEEIGGEFNECASACRHEPGEVICTLQCVLVCSFEEHEEENGHGEHAFEWAGVFDLGVGTYEWSFAKVGGDYTDPAMKMIVLEAEDIESSEETAEELLESENSESKKDGDELVAKETAYSLNFDETKDMTVFTVKIEKAGKYAFFTEHMPFEFEDKEHFFKDVSGNDVEPIEQEPESGHHHHGEYDPHFWLDFNNDVKVVDAIADTLSKMDPANKESYLANAENYNQKLAELDNSYKQGLESCKQKEFITGGHNAYAYLAKSYDIGFLSAYGISPDSEPTPKAIKEIADLTEEHGIKYILFEELVSPRMAEAIAEQTGAKTMMLNPGHNLMKEEFDQGVTFISLMESNLDTLKAALECE